MDEQDEDVVIPIVGEELYADAVPVMTGGVRVTKRVKSHDEIVEQELRKSHVEVKRVKTNRVVDGPQAAHRLGKTLIIPVVSEVLRVEKQWIVTEEIHITEQEERETVQSKVTLNREEVQVERVDESGNVVSSVREVTEEPVRSGAAATPVQPSLPTDTTAKRKTLSDWQGILKP